MANDQTETLLNVRKKLRSEGITVVEWAKRNGFKLCSVRAVIYGHNKGHFGQAHEIAVALGIKNDAK